MKKFNLFASAIAAAFFMASCGDSTQPEEPAEQPAEQPDTTAAMEMEMETEFISVPSPDEMFSFMKAIGGEGKSTAFLNNPDNIKNYVDNKSKALNFGIYATDFLYCSTFDFSTEGLKYFVAVKKLGDELGISGVVSEEMQNRIKANAGKSDSLMDLSNTLYYAAISELEKSDKAPVLALLIAGGWVESMHLVTNMIKKFKADNPAVERIAEQKYTLDNLIEYMQRYSGADEGVTSVVTQLEELKGVYAQLKEETVGGSVSSKDGKKTLGGGTRIGITEEQFKAIASKVKSIRDSFTMIK